jgi:NAD-dependent SIR2 family protein deacetylase
MLVARNPGYEVTAAATAPDGDVRLERSFDDFVLVNCDHCGGILKPSVVFFGENVPGARVAQARHALAHSGGMLVVGSSLMVYSGYRFCRQAESLGTPIAAVNRGRTRADAMLELKVPDDCAAVLEAAAQLLTDR